MFRNRTIYTRSTRPSTTTHCVSQLMIDRFGSLSECVRVGDMIDDMRTYMSWSDIRAYYGCPDAGKGSTLPYYLWRATGHDSRN